MSQLVRTSAPRIGDYVVYTREPVAGNPPTLAAIWDRRRRERSLVVGYVGHQQWELVTHGDRAAESWVADTANLRVVGRATWALLDEYLDRATVAAALDGSTVALDFDGPIHSYRRGWTGYVPEDPPSEGALEFVTFLLAAGARVVVHTSRADSLPGKEGVRSYLRQHGFPPLEVTYEKVPAAAYVDDRAVHYGRQGFDDVLLAEVVRMCRTRHSGEYHPTERFDTASSASRQHFIDTGTYLTTEEATP